jgi:hypothetical protein
MSEFPDVSVETRVSQGHRVKRLYHDDCDDGAAHGDGHMQVVQTGPNWVYRCSTCGHEVPYDEFDTAMTTGGWR